MRGDDRARERDLSCEREPRGASAVTGSYERARRASCEPRPAELDRGKRAASGTPRRHGRSGQLKRLGIERYAPGSYTIQLAAPVPTAATCRQGPPPGSPALRLDTR